MAGNKLKEDAAALMAKAKTLALDYFRDVNAAKLIRQDDGTPISGGSQAKRIDAVRARMMKAKKELDAERDRLKSELPPPHKVGEAAWLADPTIRFSPTVPAAASYESDRDKSLRLVLEVLMADREDARTEREAEHWRRLALAKPEDARAAIDRLALDKGTPDYEARVRAMYATLTNTPGTPSMVLATARELAKSAIPARYLEAEQVAVSASRALREADTYLTCATYGQCSIATESGHTREIISQAELWEDAPRQAERVKRIASLPLDDAPMVDFSRFERRDATGDAARPTAVRP